MTPRDSEPIPPCDGGGAVEPLDPLLVAEALADLAAGQARLEEIVAQMAGDVEPVGGGGGRWTWRYLAHDAAEALMRELSDWVDWLIVRYKLRDDRHAIESCWREHPVAVEELTALMLAWKAEFGTAVRRPSAGPIAWHANWLWPTLERVNQLSGTRSCRSQGHRDSAVS